MGKSLGEIKNSATKDDLKKWCGEAYDLPFKGENSDTEYKLANKFCSSSNGG